MADEQSRRGFWWAVNAGLFVPLSFVVAPAGLMSIADAVIDWHGFLGNVVYWWELQILDRIDKLLVLLGINFDIPDIIKSYVICGFIFFGSLFRGVCILNKAEILDNAEVEPQSFESQFNAVDRSATEKGEFSRFSLADLMLLPFTLLVFVISWPIAAGSMIIFFIIVIFVFILAIPFYVFSGERKIQDFLSFLIAFFAMLGPFIVFGALAAINHFVLAQASTLPG